ncbi:MAG: hypothetical protein HY364_01985 [Candidatus Aenigmarchaeota archaeon]|nr:hypothetical protein [Candidatus Aenigmarchaeota archaeon]
MKLLIAAALIWLVMPVSSASVVEGVNQSAISGNMIQAGENIYKILFTVTPAGGSGLPSIYVIEKFGLVDNLTAAYAESLASLNDTEKKIRESNERISALHAIFDSLVLELDGMKIRKAHMDAWKLILDKERTAIERGRGGIIVSAGEYNLILAAFAAMMALMLLYKFFYKKLDDRKESNAQMPQEYVMPAEIIAPAKGEKQAV